MTITTGKSVRLQALPGAGGEGPPSEREQLLEMLNRGAMILFSKASGERDFDSAMAEAINLVASMAGVDRLSMFRNSTEEDGLYFHQLYRWRKNAGGSVRTLPQLARAAYREIFPALENSLKNGDCVNGPVRLIPGARALMAFGCMEILVVPVFRDNEFWGFTFFEKLRDERFTPQEAETLQSASIMLAVALMHNEKLSEIEHRDSLLQAVNHIASILLQSRGRDLSGNIERSLRILGEAVGADRVYVFQNANRDGRECCTQIFEWSGGAEPQQDKDIVTETAYSDFSPKLYARLSQGHCINDIVNRLPEAERSFLSAQQIKSILMVPIFLENTFWGFIGFDDCHSERLFSKNDETVLRSASEIIGGAVFRAKLEVEAGKIFFDPLTGIRSRRYFDDRIRQLIQTLSRSGSLMTLMMIDVDHFKRYNDLYGHIQGDVCLRAVARALAGCMTRADDFVARYGGEEFVVVLPNTDEAGARVMAGKLIAAVRAAGLRHEENPSAGQVTISIGSVTGRVLHTHSGRDFVMQADKMLYDSKQNGRNQALFAAL